MTGRQLRSVALELEPPKAAEAQNLVITMGDDLVREISQDVIQQLTQ